MSKDENYHCMDCDKFFGDIPALGCPYCGSENWYSINNELETYEYESLGIGSMM